MQSGDADEETDLALRARFRGAFIGCLIGDAMGRPFELMSSNDGRLAPALRAMLKSPRPWRYTDDSEMMIAVAESLVRMSCVSTNDLLASLATSYDPARGYGHGMKLALDAFQRGESGDPAFASWPEGSKGNGAAVRVVAIACAHHDQLALLATLADDSAKITHAHPLGRAGAIAHALAMACTLRHSGAWSRASTTNLVATLARDPSIAHSVFASKLRTLVELASSSASSQEAADALGNGTLAEEAVPLALFCFVRWAPDFEAVVTNAVLAGGDTDTITAMSGALCGALVGDEQIPARWIRRLDHEAKGPAHVRALADATFAMWSGRRRVA